MKSALALASALFGGGAAATFLGLHGRTIPPPLVDNRSGPQKRSSGTGVFQQLIDHADPSLGTFPQRFWWSDEFWAGPRSPVVLFTPGEIAAPGYTGYLTNATITGLFAQAISGAVVMLEHRYWGASSPYEDLTVEHLQHLTLANSIADTTYFARSVALPFDANGTSSAPKAPWVLSGGSYSGALSAWVEAKDPGTFWAYHASSAVVESIADFWQYFAPVQEGMPKNCSADVAKVIDHVDRVLKTDDDAAKQALKDQFGLGSIVHDDDFASALENGPWQWQDHDFDSGYSGFYEFCDYVENAYAPAFPNAKIPGKEGVGLPKALNGYARWTKEVMLPGTCESYGYWMEEYNTDCFDTYNASSPFYTDISLDNAVNRQWNWFLCNEPFEFWQDSAPPGRPSLVSRLVTPAYWRRQCGLFFPPEGAYSYGLAEGRGVRDVNAYTGGWGRAGGTTRLVWTNGQFDPWRDATVSSEFRPGGPFLGTPEAPVQVIPGGIHCSDLIAANGRVNAGVQAVIDNEVAVVKGWVDEFYAKR